MDEADVHFAAEPTFPEVVTSPEVGRAALSSSLVSEVIRSAANRFTYKPYSTHEAFVFTQYVAAYRYKNTL